MNLFEKMLSDPDSFLSNFTIQEPDEVLDGKEVLRRSLGISRMLQQDKAKASDHIGVLMPNCATGICTLLGVMFSRKVVVPLNPLLTAHELVEMARSSDIKSVLTISCFREKVSEVIHQSNNTLHVVYLDEALKDSGQKGGGELSMEDVSAFVESLKQIPDDEPVFLIHTSGTQGKNKGVLLSHKNIVANVQGMVQRLEVDSHDVFLVLLPMFHVFALTVTAMLPLCCHSRMVLMRSINPVEIQKAIETENITAVVGVPTIYSLLLKHMMTVRMDTSSIRFCVSGGAHLPVLIEKGLQELTGGKLLVGYGLTEAAPVVAVNPPGASRIGSVGLPLKGVTVQIWDEEGNALDPNRSGEIMVRGDNAMLGYYKSPEANAQTITEEGWLRTGDVGYLDEDGYLFVTGRKKEIIIRGGENIYPQEIEEVLEEHPDIIEAAVVGIVDEERGEYPKAYIRSIDGRRVSDGDLRKFMKDRLAVFKWPREFEFLDEFPRNAVGKIMKHKLSEPER